MALCLDDFTNGYRALVYLHVTGITVAASAAFRAGLAIEEPLT
jgi:hypothetical protein